ncbi:MAB_1171c family putative transporter [Streptomyces sp. NPDC101206]|uniref:MAB_1171c family putative transporter n=1 Tax=Streptomyces sp. NPDC101206 TaxID=3366128 RepID=UPI0037FCA32C
MPESAVPESAVPESAVPESAVPAVNDPQGLGFYLPGCVLLLATLLKLPALRRNPRDELLRAVCVLLALATAVFAFTAIPSLVAVNRMTGVPNAAAPLVYSLITAFSGANIVLILHWSRGPADVDGERTRRRARLCAAITVAVIVAINTLFVLGDAPVERLRDLDTYYANTPFIRETILLYLTAHTTAAVTMTVLCWGWAREVRGALRAGLALIVVGYVLNLCYDVAKFAAVGARWAGRDWDVLAVEVAPALASVSALLIAAGFVLPLVAEPVVSRWRMWRRYRRLRPLHEELRGATERSIDLSAGGGWVPIEIRLTQRESDIHDGILTVNPYLQAELRDRALRRELADGRPAEEAAAVADAAALVSAVVRWERAGTEATPSAGPDAVLTSPSSPQGLVRMSLALSRSATVRSFRRSALEERSPAR